MITSGAINRADLAQRAEAEEARAGHLENQAQAHLRKAEQLAAQAHRHRIRAELLQELAAPRPEEAPNGKPPQPKLERLDISDGVPVA